MTTAAEPRPAELPLPGGRAGATVKLHPLLTGRMRGPEPWLLREQGRLAWRRAFGFGVKKEVERKQEAAVAARDAAIDAHLAAETEAGRV